MTNGYEDVTPKEELRQRIADLQKENDGLRATEREWYKWKGIAEHRQTVIDCHNIKIERLQAKLDAAAKALGQIPLSEYGSALCDGCDSNRAWDCFCEELEKWRNALLGEINKK